jgi:cell division protein FtsQ
MVMISGGFRVNRPYGRRQRRPRPILNRTRSFLLIAISVTALCTGAAALTAWTRNAPLFDLDAIDIGGADRLIDQEALQMISMEKGVNIFTIDLKAIQHNIERDPRIRKVTIRRRLPSTIAVTIREREPVMLIGGDALFALDETGMVMPVDGSGRPLDIPVLTGLSFPVDYGDGGDHLGIQKGLEIKRVIGQEAPVLWDAVSEINLLQPESPCLYLVPGGTEIRLGGGDLHTQIQRLWIVLQDLAARDMTVSTIDARFKDQLVCRSAERGWD